MSEVACRMTLCEVVVGGEEQEEEEEEEGGGGGCEEGVLVGRDGGVCLGIASPSPDELAGASSASAQCSACTLCTISCTRSTSRCGDDIFPVTGSRKSRSTFHTIDSSIFPTSVCRCCNCTMLRRALASTAAIYLLTFVQEAEAQEVAELELFLTSYEVRIVVCSKNRRD